MALPLPCAAPPLTVTPFACSVFGPCGVELMVHVAQRLFPADAAALQCIEADSTVVEPVGVGLGGTEARGAGAAAAAKVRVDCCAYVLYSSIPIPMLSAAVVPWAHAVTR
jgi:hypothetical protein